MTGRALRVDRTVVALLGLLLLAGGVLGLVRSAGGFGRAAADAALVTDGQVSLAERYSPWTWVALAVAGALVALLALRWLMAQLRTDGLRTLDLEPDDAHGTTTLQSSAVSTAVREEVEGYRGVSGASASLHDDPHHPRLELRVDVDDRADLVEVRRRVEQEAVAHVRQALELDTLSTRLVLRPGGARRRPALR